MGLAFSSIANTQAPTFFETLVTAGKLETAMFSFSMLAAPVSVKTAAQLAQSTDTDAVTTVPNSGHLFLGGWDPAAAASEPVWQPVTTQGFWQTDIGLKVNGQTMSAKYSTIFDSGTSLFYLPAAIGNGVFQAIGAQSTSEEGMAVMPCANIASVKLAIHFAGQDFLISPDDLNAGQAAPGSKMCYLSIVAVDVRSAVLIAMQADVKARCLA